jgi:hypothetical protein
VHDGSLHVTGTVASVTSTPGIDTLAALTDCLGPGNMALKQANNGIQLLSLGGGERYAS